jgi:glycosyltransferase involved in cell wall biosynthesis
MNNLAAWFTDKVITYTRDYADHSPYTSRYLAKVGIIQPPVELPSTDQDSIDHFRTEHRLTDRGPVIGLAARFAAEKGVEVLLDSIPAIIAKFPKAVILFAGQYKDVLGEDSYANRLFPIIEKYIQEGHWEWLGVLDQQKMAAFYKILDVLTVPSLNSTESFGLVQIEAMMNGVPVVASNLPGVRQPVLMTGMGEIAEIGDSKSLSECLIKVLSNRTNYRVDHTWIENNFSPRKVAQEYLKLYRQLLDTKE